MSRRHAAVAVLPLTLVLSGCAGTAASEGGSGSATQGAASTTPSAGQVAEAPDGTRFEVQVAGGRVTGDTGRLPVALGEQVTVTVTGDRPDELHLHGYDVTAELVPGTPAELTFDATVPGVFELELHEAGTVLLTLQVS